MTAHLQSTGSTAQALSVFCAEGAAVGFVGICTSWFLIDQLCTLSWWLVQRRWLAQQLDSFNGKMHLGGLHSGMMWVPANMT